MQNKTIYVIDPFQINALSVEETTYYEYLNDHCKDTYEVKELDNLLHTQWKVIDNGHEYEIYYDSEDEAREVMYQLMDREITFRLERENFPEYYPSYDDAVTRIAEIHDKPLSVVQRYLAMKANFDAREKVIKAQALANLAILHQQIKLEADSIEADDEFVSAIHAAENLNGREKNDVQARAFTSLLSRRGFVIETDFWKVFRIVKLKIKHT